MAQIKRLEFLQSSGWCLDSLQREPTETTTRDLRLSELPVSPLPKSSGGCKNDNKHCKMGEEGGGGRCAGSLTL